MKKTLSLILSLVLILGVFSFNSSNKVYSDNINQSNILDDIKNNNFIQDIKKIDYDSKKQEIKSITDINLNSKSLHLGDGTYLIDRGYGWVLGNDSSFIESGFANAGEELRINRGKMMGTEHSIITGVGVGLDLKVVKLTVETTYEHTISDETDISVGFIMRAPSDKNFYVKTYATYRRFDMIKIQNGGLAGHTATYEATGTWAKRVAYSPGETVDQNALKEKVPRNILGEPEEVDIRNTISVIGLDYVKNFDIIMNSTSRSLEVANRSNVKIHPGFGDNEYFSITLSDSNGKVKASMKMNGNDYSNDPKFNAFNKIVFDIGDIITIYHKEPFRLKMYGNIYGKLYRDEQIQKYEITQSYLKALNTKVVIPDGFYNLENMYLGDYFLNKENENIGTIKNNYNVNVIKGRQNIKQKWKIEYDSSKNAYRIYNIDENGKKTLLSLNSSDNNVICVEDYSSNDQLWTFDYIENEELYLIESYSKPNMVLDLQELTSNKSNNVIVRAKNKLNRQKFALRRLNI